MHHGAMDMTADTRRFALGEPDFQAQVIEVAHLFGWRVAHFRPAQTRHGWRTPVAADGAGWPDLFMVRRDRSLAIEVKSASGRTTPDQDAWLAAMARAGIPAMVARPDDFDAVVELLR